MMMMIISDSLLLQQKYSALANFSGGFFGLRILWMKKLTQKRWKKKVSTLKSGYSSTRRIHPYTLPVARWDIILARSINWYSPLYRCCFFRSDGISLSLLYLNNFINMNYCILFCRGSDDLRGFDEHWNSDKLQQRAVKG